MKLPAKKTVIFLFIIVAVLCIFMFVLSPQGRIYETNSICDYGRYIGNYNNETPQAFINSFFPAELDDRFSEVGYHYKAKRFDTYSYEAYLDFCIDDSELFDKYLEEITARYGTPEVFSYDNKFEEYSISNVYCIASNKKTSGNDTYRILSAQIGKILVSRASQQIVYVAIGLHDGGGTNTEELSYFFDKFGINPCEYANSAYDSVFEEQKNKIY